MDDEVAMNTTELKFVLLVKDRQQVDHMLRQLVKLSYVSRAYRILPTA